MINPTSSNKNADYECIECDENDVSSLQNQLRAMERKLQNARHISEAHQTFSKEAHERELKSQQTIERLTKQCFITNELLDDVMRMQEIKRLEQSCMSQRLQMEKLEQRIRELQSDPLLTMPCHVSQRKQLKMKQTQLTSIRNKLQQQSRLLDTYQKEHDLNEQMRNAANHGHEAEVIQLIQIGATVNVPDEFGMSAFIYACRNGNTSIVQSMIPKADLYGEHRLHIFHSSHPIPFHLAAQQGHIETLDLLLQNNVNIEQTDARTGKTALLVACERNNDDHSYQCISFLLEKGANVHVRDNYGNTCLHVSICAESKKKKKIKQNSNDSYNTFGTECANRVIISLLDAGIDKNIANVDGLTAYELAFTKGCKLSANIINEYGK